MQEEKFPCNFLIKHCQFASEIVIFELSNLLPIWRFTDQFDLEIPCKKTYFIIQIGNIYF